MKSTSFFFGLTLAVCVSFSASAADSGRAAVDVAADAAASLNAQAALARANAPINSQLALSTYLASPAAQRSPLNLLAASSKARFLDSLKFNETGVTSFYYADIERELSASQAYELLKLFGLTNTIGPMKGLRIDNAKDRSVMSAYGSPVTTQLMDDHQFYWCSSRATCSSMSGSWCMSGC